MRSIHARARLQTHRAPVLVDNVPSGISGVALCGRLCPWGVFVESGGDWFDAVPLDDGNLVGIVVGNVGWTGSRSGGRP